MLTNITVNTELLATVFSEIRKPEEYTLTSEDNPQIGVYNNVGFNFEHFVKEKLYMSSYGVADNIQQVLDVCTPLVEDRANSYCIFCQEVLKSEQPINGGWRWHKWGEYHGTQNPKCEYLYNEPDIESVLVFMAYKLI